MSDIIRHHIENIFHSAAELAPEARPAFLNQVCGGDRPPRGGIQPALALLAWSVAAMLASASAGLCAPPPSPGPVPLTGFAGTATHPAFSPDGQRVAFAWNGESGDNWDIYVKRVGDANAKASRLTHDPADDQYPAWSRDGRQIAFFSSRGGGGIYVVSPDGGPERKLCDLSTDSRLSWSPDGKYLLVAKLYRAAQPQTGDGALLRVQVRNEAAPRPVLAPPNGTWYKDPTLAPDGRSLAFVACTNTPDGLKCSLQIANLQADLVPSGPPRQIIEQAWHISGLAWMPDGSSVVFGGNSWERGPYLWRVNVKGGKQPEQVEAAGAGATYPAVDKAGRLVFSRDLTHGNIWRMEPGGKPAPLLTSSATDYAPQYSPDGRRIAFSSNRTVSSFTIWAANADGTGPARVTRVASPWSGAPRWSPDGRHITFDSFNKGGGWDIWVVNADGSSPRQLTQGPPDNPVPSWSHDGKWIYFASERTGRFEIWRIPAAGGTAVQITHNGGWTAFDSTDGKTLYYTSRAPGADGLYAQQFPNGEVKQVLKGKDGPGGFAVFSDGIYYVHQRGARSFEIRFLEFAGGATRPAGEIEGLVPSGFTVSPDRKTFLFSKLCDEKSGLMLIGNFR
jgi:Tol biopolymer transport system component